MPRSQQTTGLEEVEWAPVREDHLVHHQSPFLELGVPSEVVVVLSETNQQQLVSPEQANVVAESRRADQRVCAYAPLLLAPTLLSIQQSPPQAAALLLYTD